MIGFCMGSLNISGMDYFFNTCSNCGEWRIIEGEKRPGRFECCRGELGYNPSQLPLETFEFLRGRAPSSPKLNWVNCQSCHKWRCLDALVRKRELSGKIEEYSKAFFCEAECLECSTPGVPDSIKKFLDGTKKRKREDDCDVEERDQKLIRRIEDRKVIDGSRSLGKILAQTAVLPEVQIEYRCDEPFGNPRQYSEKELLLEKKHAFKHELRHVGRELDSIEKAREKIGKIGAFLREEAKIIRRKRTVLDIFFNYREGRKKISTEISDLKFRVECLDFEINKKKSLLFPGDHKRPFLLEIESLEIDRNAFIEKIKKLEARLRFVYARPLVEGETEIKDARRFLKAREPRFLRKLEEEKRTRTFLKSKNEEELRAREVILEYDLRRCKRVEEWKIEVKMDKYRRMSEADLRECLRLKRAQRSRLKQELEFLPPFEIDIEEDCIRRNIANVEEEIRLISRAYHDL